MSVNSMQYLQTPPRMNPDRVMGGASRELPSRKAMQSSHIFETYPLSPPKTYYEQALAQTLFPNYSSKTLHYNPPKKYIPIPEPKPQPIQPKKVEIVPFKTHYLSQFEDNYYSNNLDWGKQFLAYNAKNVSYILNTVTNQAFEGFKSVHYHRCIKWSLDGKKIALGNSEGRLCICDLIAQKILFDSMLFEGSEKLEDPYASIAAIDWGSEEECTIASYGNVIHYDVRSGSFPWQLRPIQAQVCSLAWSSDGRFLARGGNDNKVGVYDRRNPSIVLHKYSHRASIKALKWMPNSSLLLSGGGVADRRIKLFDVKQGQFLSEVDAGAQVCSIEYLGNNTFVSGLGYNDRENILSWKCDADFTIKRTNELFVNNQPNIRVFNISKNPNALEFSSIASNGDLRFWKPPSTPKKALLPSFPTIR